MGSSPRTTFFVDVGGAKRGLAVLKQRTLRAVSIATRVLRLVAIAFRSVCR